MRHDKEKAALAKDIPFPVPYAVSLDKHGFLDIEFNHQVEIREDLESIVNQGLIRVSLISESLDVDAVVEGKSN